MTVLSKKGSNSGAKDGVDSESSTMVLHREAQALMKRVEDFPSRTAWWVLIPMANPLSGNRVIWRAITEALESEDSKWGTKQRNSDASLGALSEAWSKSASDSASTTETASPGVY